MGMGKAVSNSQEDLALQKACNGNPEKIITDNLYIWSSAIKKKKATGRGSNKKIELYGIKKLRELILELAVRGKLVPQDPNDEPASELLKKIAAEKAKLIKEGEIKKQKSLPPISDDEKLFEIPVNWEFSRFGSVLDFSGGSQPPKSTFSDEPLDGYVQLIQIRDLGPKPQPVFVPKEKVSKFCTSDDVMVGRYGASVGKVFWGKDGAYNVALIKLHNEYGAYIKEYLYILMQSPHGQSFFSGISRSAQAGFSKGDIENNVLPILSYSEQHRIVAKVDELMALCDQLEQQQENSISAHQELVETLLGTLTNSKTSEDFQESWARIAEHFDTLFTTEHSIDQLKQTILQLAVMGKLVTQDPNDEPASELIKKIAAEKAKLIKEGKIKKQKPLLPRTDEEKPFELPEGWEWCLFDDVVDIQSGITKGRKLAGRTTVTVPYLSVANVQRSYLILQSVKEVDIPIEEKEKYKVLYGDLLITEGGDWDKVGRTAIWRGEMEYVAHQNHVFKARVFLQIQSEVWLEKYLNSPFAREYFAGSSKQTTNLASINKTQLRGCLIALPPVREKELIVKKIDELMALCDNLKARFNDAQTTQLHLADAMAEQALG